MRVAHKGLTKLNWQLAVVAGTFTDKSVFETIDLLHALNIHHIELTPGQQLESSHPNSVVCLQMTDKAIDSLLAKLKSVHMDIVSLGPVDLGPDDAATRNMLAFARKIKAKQIVASPPAGALQRIDGLAEEYGISLAIANGTTAYQTPDDLLNATALPTNHSGSDDDLLQWKHAGVDPLLATRALRGHIVQLRVADPQRDIDLSAILSELKNQKFKGVITIAATPGSGLNTVQRVAESINALSDAVTKVAGN